MDESRQQDLFGTSTGVGGAEEPIEWEPGDWETAREEEPAGWESVDPEPAPRPAAQRVSAPPAAVLTR